MSLEVSVRLFQLSLHLISLTFCSGQLTTQVINLKVASDWLQNADEYSLFQLGLL